jgi:hypothetical protein
MGQVQKNLEFGNGVFTLVTASADPENPGNTAASTQEKPLTPDEIRFFRKNKGSIDTAITLDTKIQNNTQIESLQAQNRGIDKELAIKGYESKDAANAMYGRVALTSSVVAGVGGYASSKYRTRHVQAGPLKIPVAPLIMGIAGIAGNAFAQQLAGKDFDWKEAAIAGTAAAVGGATVGHYTKKTAVQDIINKNNRLPQKVKQRLSTRLNAGTLNIDDPSKDILEEYKKHRKGIKRTNRLYTDNAKLTSVKQRLANQNISQERIDTWITDNKYGQTIIPNSGHTNKYGINDTNFTNKYGKLNLPDDAAIDAFILENNTIAPAIRGAANRVVRRVQDPAHIVDNGLLLWGGYNAVNWMHLLDPLKPLVTGLKVSVGLP